MRAGVWESALRASAATAMSATADFQDAMAAADDRDAVSAALASRAVGLRSVAETLATARDADPGDARVARRQARVELEIAGLLAAPGQTADRSAAEMAESFAHAAAHHTAVVPRPGDPESLAVRAGALEAWVRMEEEGAFDALGRHPLPVGGSAPTAEGGPVPWSPA